MKDVKIFGLMVKYLALVGWLLAGLSLRAQHVYTVHVGAGGGKPERGFLKMGPEAGAGGSIMSYTDAYLTKDGLPWYPVMGELHYSRVAAKDWERSILLMKAAGVQVISTYVIWNHHEEREGVFDFSGDRDLRHFLLLCHRHGMYVWLRPGPWVHAEVRNGGFPDWLLNKKIGLRKNDTAYLRMVRSFWNVVAKQCAGYWFRDSGTIIGVQIENELPFKTPEGLRHMQVLKSMAIEEGMVVPYYSAFGQGPEDQVDFLYMMGSYPDSPWGQHTKKLVKPLYFIKPLEADRDIGADLLGKVDGKVRNRYPKLSAEIGGGMQVTYHRRVDVSAMDVSANAFTKVASGLNGLGYYMFCGGVNPVGATSLQESRATGYPNDVPLLNYDFEAPVGAMGMVRESYAELRLQHLFLAEYGSVLAAMQPYFGTERKMLATSTDTLQCSVRAKDGAGFIFLSNYQRHVPQPVIGGMQLRILSGRGEELVPERPVLFAADDIAVWPWHLRMGSSELVYATAQPLCVLRNAGKVTYVFYASGASEFVYKLAAGAVVEGVVHGRYESERGAIGCEGNKVAMFRVMKGGEDTVEVMVLPKVRALGAYKMKAGGGEVLVVSDAAAMYGDDGDGWHVEGAEHVQLAVYPAVDVRALTAGFSVRKDGVEDGFVHWVLSPLRKARGSLRNSMEGVWADTGQARRNRDSVLSVYARSKTFVGAQPGPLYQLSLLHFPGESMGWLTPELRPHPLVDRWMVRIRYVGDMLALYREGRLVYDDFNDGDACWWKLDLGERFQWQVLPLARGSDVYVEDGVKQARDVEWGHASLDKVTLVPVYHYVLRLH